MKEKERRKGEGESEERGGRGQRKALGIKEEEAGGRAGGRAREGDSTEREHKVTQRSSRHTGFDIPPQPHTDLHLLRMRQTAETQGAPAVPRAVL